jgi:uncharacterized membrane protein YeaQ/YmgE (transglycosylase-associated protein family)
MHILFILITGAIAGWLGSLIFKGSSLGIIGNIVIGVLGSIVGYWLLGKLGIFLGGGLIGSILTAAIGAIVILVIIQIITGKK